MKRNNKNKGLALSNSKGFTLIEILIVIGILAVLAAIVLVAINPARQFRQANDSQRSSNVNAILNAIGQYTVDNKGTIPSAITTTAQDISTAGANLCSVLVPKYLPSLPTDPKSTPLAGASVSDCSVTGGYDTDYQVVKDAEGRVTVSAPNTEEATPDISVTR